MHRILLPLSLAVLLSACGGGEDAAVESPAASQDAEVRRTAQAAGPLSDSQRIAAASSTANSSSNACSAARPFYWEIGASNARLAAGSVNSSTSNTSYTAGSPLALASASKWVYAAYVAQRRGGVLTTTDVKHLTMRSGYTNMYIPCTSKQTVDSCLAANGNGSYNAVTDNHFVYGAGHMQKHASLLGLGALLPKALGSEVQSKLGTDVQIGYMQPTLAGGAYGTPDAYARFLRKILGGQLKMSGLLGTNSVCTTASSCGFGGSLSSPLNVSSHYSIGHWVEDEPGGDGAFNSLGALGFYPWIDASRSYYGIVARVKEGGMEGSAQCGKLIRTAWMTGSGL